MTRARRAERARRATGRIELKAGALGSLVAWAALLLLAPPADNGFWGVNGFRSLEPGPRVALLLVAALTMALVWVRSRGMAAAIAVATAVAIAFPFRERIHFLGDTQVRLRAMAIFTADMVSATMTEWSTRLHANPLDILIDFLAPIGLRRLGLSLVDAVSVVAATLAVLYLAALWRVAGRLTAAREAQVPLCGAMALSGALLAFAGYAESAGLLLVSAAWWWSEMLAPLDRPQQAWRTAGAWLVMALCHRLALVMLVPLAWRALGRPLEGDRPEVRRQFMVGGAVATLLVLGVMQLGAGGRQLGMDMTDMMRSLTDMLRAVPPSDYLNMLALVAPLAWVAPWLAGRAALATFVREPAGQLLIAGSLVLLPLVWMVPANGYGLGAHRDWDLATLGGLTLTITAAALLATRSGPQLQATLRIALPVLTLGAGGWLMVNASETAVLLRARALVEKPPGLIDPHAAHLHDWLGQRAMDLGEPAYAAPEFERSFDLNRNPRRALLAAEAWARAGELPHARAMLARAHTAGPLSPTVTESARRIGELIARMAADSSGAAAPGSGR